MYINIYYLSNTKKNIKNIMTYRTTLMYTSFWFLESRKTAEYMLNGLNKKEMMDIIVNDDIYQVNSDKRSIDMVRAIYKRLINFPKELLEKFLNVDITSAKSLLIIGIMSSDELFFEFMNQTFKNHILFGDYTFKKRDLDIFFENKINQSETVANWSENGIKRLEQGYLSVLREAGLLTKENKIVIPFIDLYLKEALIKNNFGSFLSTITGETY